MIRVMMFFIAIGLVFVGCSQDKTNDSTNEENTTVDSEESSPGTEENLLQYSPEYVAKNEGELSIQDSETAYELCVSALTAYYNAIWNGSDIELDTFIANENLKQYTQNKIQSVYYLIY